MLVHHARRRGADMNHPIGSHTRSNLAVAAVMLAALAGASTPRTARAQSAVPSPAKATPERIRAVTRAVDGAAIQANAATSKDWPTIGADYAETRYSKLAEITASNVK